MTKIEELQQIILENEIKAQKRREESDKRLEKLEKFIDKEVKDTKKLKEMIFGIGRNQGLVAEEFFENSIKPTQNIGGIDYDFMITNTKRHKRGLEGEYDIVLVNGKDLALIEVKYNAHINDLDKFINKQYPTFQKLYPEYKDYNHHLGFASFYINDDFKQEALKHGVMILQRKGDIVETTLPDTNLKG